MSFNRTFACCKWRDDPLDDVCPYSNQCAILTPCFQARNAYKIQTCIEETTRVPHPVGGRSPSTGDNHPGSHERELSLPASWTSTPYDRIQFLQIPWRVDTVSPSSICGTAVFSFFLFHIGGFTIPLDSL